MNEEMSVTFPLQLNQIVCSWHC